MERRFVAFAVASLQPSFLPVKFRLKADVSFEVADTLYRGVEVLGSKVKVVYALVSVTVL